MVFPGHTGGMTSELPIAEATCEQCGLPRPESLDIISRHRTSRGVIVYTVCICGILEAWLCPSGGGMPMLMAQGGQSMMPLRTAI